MTVEYWNDQHVNKYSKTDWIRKPSIFSEQVVKFFPKTGKLLEIGTGQGGDSNFFKSLGYEVVATDYSDSALELAKNNVKDVTFLRVDTSQSLPFDSESFDVVYSHMALHYFDSQTTKKVFEEIYRVLKPGGIFATITNTLEDPEIKDFGYEEIEPGYYQDPIGIRKRYFRIDTLKPFVDSLFEIILFDEKGTTYKDDLDNLVRFVGRKK